MMTLYSTTVLILAALVVSANAFTDLKIAKRSTPFSIQQSSSSTSLHVSSSIGNSNNDNNNNSNDDESTTSTSTTRGMSRALPFVQEPQVLALVRSMPGNNGFDPLGFCKNLDDVYYYREAEIRHARLAMLAVVGWPLSELWDRTIANVLGMPSLLDDYDRVPAILNGGILDKVSPAFWGFCIGLTAAIEQVAISKSRNNDINNNTDDNTYFPGNLGFDPLSLYPKTIEGQNKMQLAEIKHGRLAMIAVTGFAIQEYVTRLSIVDETPFFFKPLF